jgi:uncharacterized protein (UPF0264 family)
VRSLSEAEAALAGGAAVIDIKEPSRGPLGRADDAVIEAIVTGVAGRRLVSAALGEWAGGERPRTAGLAFVKWGLAGCRNQDLTPWCRALGTGSVVAVAYADAERANAPEPQEIAALAIRQRACALLIDTHTKDGSTLRDWLSGSVLADLVANCHGHGIPVALAGSLGQPEIEKLRPLQPRWFAVRGAACVGGRGGEVDRQRVAALVAMLQSEPAA